MSSLGEHWIDANDRQKAEAPMTDLFDVVMSGQVVCSSVTRMQAEQKVENEKRAGREAEITLHEARQPFDISCDCEDD